ncbi:MAG: hypothetical protein LC777_10610, partial [Actinobacteria bacterium]|nr:hypothetical protein [Actinomycetota bacterium]
GENGSPLRESRVLRIERGRVVRAVFPPQEVAQVKAIACELPKAHGVALSRFSRAELHRFVVEQAVSGASASTIGRWLAEDAIRPWQHRSWIFSRDPDFLQKAGRVLDLYAGHWEGKPLEPGDMGDLRRRQALDPGTQTHPPQRSARTWPWAACRA